MPQFYAGALKTAKAAMRNPTGKAFDYTGVIYFGTDLAVVSEKPFDLSAGEEKQVDFPVTMPITPGIYPVHVGVFSGGQNIALYRATEDVNIAMPTMEIVKAYIRRGSPEVSEAYSGWISLYQIGGEQNLAQYGTPIQAGVLLRNPLDIPLQIIPVIYNYHWIEPNNYITDYLTVPTVEPVRFPPAPTGLPYSGYEYECNMFLPAGGTLPPGKTGFIYTELYYQSRRWNYIYLELKCNGYDLGRTLLYWGWYSY